MTISVSEALTLLSSSNSWTTAQLSQLAGELSVYAEGKVTVLYGQTVNVGGTSQTNPGVEVKTAELATELAKDPDLRIIDKTSFADVIGSDAYQKAVAEAHGTTLADLRNFSDPNPSQATIDARNFLYDAKTGIWAGGSERFIAETVGPVETISLNGDPARILGATELPMTLSEAGHGITTINGQSREYLIHARNELATRNSPPAEIERALANYVNESSRLRATNIDVSLNSDHTINSVGAREWLSKGGYGDIGTQLPVGIEANKISDPLKLLPIDSVNGETIIDTLRANAIADAKMVNDIYVERAQERFAALESIGDVAGATEAGKLLNKANAAGMVMGLMLVASEAMAAKQAGDTERAHDIIAEGLVDFANGAAIFSGIELAAVAIGALVGLPVCAFVGGILAVYGACEAFKLIPTLFESIADLFNTAGTWRQPVYDPLTLDLDGIETVSIAGNNTVLFDHNGDGLKQGTGWVKADDGLLVWDRSGNGTIDNGGELFGIDFVKSNGQKATDGFDALRDLDSNADGRFDVADDQFANVRVWRDLNQDGVSQANELQSLAGTGIALISLNAATANTNLGNGNALTHTASFTRNDGSTGTTANLNFATDVFHRQFTDHIDTSAVAALPNMQGSGAVRDLREAASLSTELAATLGQLGADTTRAELKAAVEVILKQWADGADFTDSFEAAAAQNKDLFFVPPGVSVLDAYNAHYHGLLGSYYSSTNGGEPSGLSLTNETLARYETIRIQQAHIERMLKTLEAFNGRQFAPTENPAAGSTLSAFTVGTPVVGVGLSVTRPVLFAMEQARFDLLTQSYNQLLDSVYSALAAQTRLKPFIDSISLTVTDQGITLDFNAVQQNLQARIDSDPVEGIKDLIEFNQLKSIAGTAWKGWDMLAATIRTADSNVVNVALEDLKMLTSGIFNGANGDDVRFGNTGNDSLLGNDGNDILFGRSGDDYIDGGRGNNKLWGGSGNDILIAGPGQNELYGDGGNDTLALSGSGSTGLLDGGDGNDSLTMNQETGGTLRGGAGDDTLTESYWTYGSVFEGGTGNDTLTGGHHADTYLFNLGDNHDRVSDNQYYTQTGINDRLVFVAGIAAADLQLLRNGNDLLLKHTNGTDSVTIVNWFAGTTYRIERIEFIDGTLWGTNDFQISTVNADILTGNSQDSVLVGNEGNDILNGGLGNDWLSGGFDADTLIGGAGNDAYVLARGDGIDTVVENDATNGNTDIAWFGSDIALDQLWLRQFNNNLEISIVGTEDKLIINDWYSGSAHHIEQFKTTAGQTLLDSQVDNLVAAMAAFAPPAAGQTTLPAGYLATLNPVISANWQ